MNDRFDCISKTPRFNLGRTVMTVGVSALCDNKEDRTVSGKINLLLKRHISGDYGNLSEGDIDANNQVIDGQDAGGRIFSMYEVDGHDLYIITYPGEITTIMLTDEY